MRRVTTFVLPMLALLLMFAIIGCQKDDGVSASNATGTSSSSSISIKGNGSFSPLCGPNCTHTLGYWKTHSEFGPAPEDTAWYNLPGGLGPNTLLYETGQTYYEVLWTKPQGNAYYILAHQFIAVRVNKYAGAIVEPSIVLDAYNHAHELLDMYDGNPYPMSDITGAVRSDFTNTADILDDYNMGLIGPGHCPD
jgi:hypothetical protein